MTKRFSPINSGILEGISKILCDTSNGLTGPEIGKFLQESKISDIKSGNTKWKRLYNVFATFQNKKQLSNNILTFINISMNPARFIGKEEQFEWLRTELNQRICFIGCAQASNK